MRLWADDVAALLEYLGESSAHVVGSSMGGCVAFELADHHPELVRSLTIVAGFTELDRALEVNCRMRLAIVEALGIGPLLRDHVMLWTLSREFIASPRGEHALETLMGSLSRNTPELYAEFLRAILRFGRAMAGQEGEPTFTKRLSSIAVPTLVVVGDRDILTPVAFSERIADGLPNAELAVIEGCGHITFLERPEENSRLLVDFIRRADGATH